jgi:hypothetical protein
MKRVFARARKRPSVSRLFGTLRVAHGQMHRLRQRVSLVGRDAKRGTRHIIDARSWSLSWARR